MTRKLRVFCTTWHVMHYWDLFHALEDYADFYVCYNSSKDWKSESFLAARNIPANATFVSGYESGKYDFAILNVDQQLVNPDFGKTRVFRELFATVHGDLPLVIINHGCPVYPEYLLTEGGSLIDAEIACKEMIHDMIGDTPMIVNSYTAASQKEWGWGHPIHHGMNPDEWLDLPKEPRVFTALSPGGCDTYYNRHIMHEVSRQLESIYGHQLWWAKVNINTESSPENYKQFLGRSLIYLDTSFRTPMNRARTEAMLSGCCVVQVKGAHDLERFAKDGENIIIVENNPADIATKVVDLIENHYADCIEIGQRGKETAKKHFSRARYRDDWLSFIKNELKIDYDKI